MNEDVSTPFRIAIPNGTSTFTVHVPKNHLTSDRKFFFNQLHLAPDYFSKEAETLNVDADPELDRPVTEEVEIHFKAPDPRLVYGQSYQHSPALGTTVLDAMEAINAHFETVKPDYVYGTPFFFDWVDIGVEDMLADDYVPSLAHHYYQLNYNKVIHSNWLPPSMRENKNANNFLPPFNTFILPEILATRIRIRMWLGPFVRAVFSSNQPFISHFGFDFGQFGPRRDNNQFHIVNEKPHFMPVCTALMGPNIETPLSKLDFKIYIQSVHRDIRATAKKFVIDKRSYLNDQKYFNYIYPYFDHMSKFFNIKFTLAYKLADRQFIFYWPDTEDVIITIGCTPTFAERLGYGVSRHIKVGMQSLPRPDEFTHSNALSRALALVYDTGPIVCTLEDAASNRTSGALDQFMAAIYPQESGILSMPQSVCSCVANAVFLNAKSHTSQALVPVTFRLLRIYDDQQIANFLWKCDGYVYGILQGVCIPENRIKTATSKQMI